MIELLNRRSWRCLVSLIAWAVIILTMAVEDHLSRVAMGRSLSALDGLRFPAVEYLFWALLGPFIFELARRFPLSRRQWRRNAAILFTTAIGVVLAHAAYRAPLHYFVYPPDLYPQSKLIGVSLFQFYASGNFGGDLWIFTTIVGVSYLAFYYEQDRTRTRELERAQLQVLRAQLQPHFFFNTLNSIATLMHEDVDAADDMMANLAALLRRSLRDENEYEIPLRVELEILDLYLAIERVRFEDRLRFHVDAPAECLDALVPTLLLQPLVENALRHGIASRPGPGSVEIHARRSNGRLKLEVVDDGPGLATGRQAGAGVGLTNTRARLQHHYGHLQWFSLSERPAGGVVASVDIPYRSAVEKP